MGSNFVEFSVAPLLPTTLGQQGYLPLSPSDFSFYPTENAFTLPQPLDSQKLKDSLARTLQFFPPHAGVIARHPKTQQWQIKLVNQPVRLSIGRTSEPGPFGEDWNGEQHPDYYDHLPSGNLPETEQAPLFQAKVTTWNETGQTAIMISQSDCLGRDAFAAVWFVRFWSELYQGKEPPFTPTFEKYYLPTPEVPPRASHAADLEPISWMAADFKMDYLWKLSEQMEKTTQRLDITLDGDFVNGVWEAVKRASGSNRMSRHDAFSGYLVSVLQSVLAEPVPYIYTLITLRGRTFPYNGQAFHIPKTTTGNCYMVYGCHLDQQSKFSSSSIANAMFQSRQQLKDADKLGRTYMLYNSFFEKAVSRDRLLIDVGHPDTIAVNWLVNAGLTDAHFGFPGQCGHLEWMAAENFIQVWRANPVRGTDGELRAADPDGLQIVLRLKHEYVGRFQEKLAETRSRLTARAKL
ncbi:hypothetical protein AJ80_00479 [Polytolypa hystricis UAMH7299]|uniref:Uncharacterized protein n=1 Tax=Polytolypa hystricis (strain UAMH7299) TaxID=1447883 RepID=A0A2B7Z3W1_POLH7|nr:hypothetical protein AJ80_00479 [Polytolypa hystricis UAMH7299]